MTLDAATGALAFDRGAVGASLTRAAFLASALGGAATLTVEEALHRTYDLARPLRLDGQAVAAQLHFEGERLRDVSVGFVDERFGTSWDDWSEAKERARCKAHTAWLRPLLGGRGPRWQLGWGAVESAYDPRGGAAAIRIAYGSSDAR